MSEKCPHAITKQYWNSGLEVISDYTLCEIMDMKRCLLDADMECDIYNEWLKEEEDEP